MKLEIGKVYHSFVVDGRYFKVLEWNETTGFAKLAWVTQRRNYHEQIIKPSTVNYVREGCREVSPLELMLVAPKELR